MRATGFKVGVLIASFFLAAIPVFAAQNQAKILEINGSVSYQKADSSGWVNAQVGTVLSEGDSVKTQAGSEATLELSGAAKTAVITVRESSQFVFRTFQHEAAKDTTILDVSLGAVLVKAEKLSGESKFEVKTPTSIVGIRGTTFEVKVSQ